MNNKSTHIFYYSNSPLFYMHLYVLPSFILHYLFSLSPLSSLLSPLSLHTHTLSHSLYLYNLHFPRLGRRTGRAPASYVEGRGFNSQKNDLQNCYMLLLSLTPDINRMRQGLVSTVARYGGCVDKLGHDAGDLFSHGAAL